MSYENMLMVLDAYTKYIDNHNYQGEINLTGGEPLTHPDFFRIAQEIRNRNIALGILTNGTLIDDETAAKIAKLSPKFVQISLDGPEEIHDAIRGAGQFQAALRGVDSLKKAGVKVSISFTAMKSNYTSLPALAKECQAHHVNTLWWDRVVTDDPSVYLSTEEFASILADSNSLKSKYPFFKNMRSLQCIDNKSGKVYRCNAGKRFIVIVANGDVMPCRRLPIVIGNIFKDNDLDRIIRTSLVMTDLSLPVFPTECISCKKITKCFGDAKCVSYAQTGKLRVPDVNCQMNRKGN